MEKVFARIMNFDEYKKQILKKGTPLAILEGKRSE